MTTLPWGQDHEDIKEQVPTVQFESVNLASIAGLDSSKWVLELRTCEHHTDYLHGLDDLFANPADPNVFFEQPFFSASFERVGKVPKFFLITWEILGEAQYPRLALPVLRDKVGLPPHSVWKTSENPFAPLSTPLLHSDNHETTVTKFAELLEKADFMDPKSLLFENLELGSNFYKNLSLTNLAGIIDEFTFLQTQRAFLNAHADTETFEKYNMSSKRRRELRRQLRRLEELGTIELERATTPIKALLRFEEFMLLETRSWKGQKKSAINDVKKIAAFARQAVSNLAENNACAIYSLRLEDKAIASLVMFRTKNRYYPWKIAYCPDHASYAPGLILFWMASKDLVETANFEGADSLASEKNPLTSAIWKDKMELGQVLLPVGKSTAGMRSTKKAIERKAKIKQQVKKLLKR